MCSETFCRMVGRLRANASADAFEGSRILDRAAAGFQVGKALTGLAASDARLLVRHVDEASRFGGLARIDDGARVSIVFEEHPGP
jgi:hypothetical protein